MKRKICAFMMGIVLLLSLASCNLSFTNPNFDISSVLTDDANYEIIQTNITKTVEEVKKSCVGVYVELDNSASIGSGVIYKMIDKNTNEDATEDSTDVLCYVVTNEHVINSTGSSKARYYVYLGNDDYIKADPVGSDATNDLAVLTFSVDLTDYDLTTCEMFEDESNLALVGNFCIAIGCPLDLNNYNYVSIGNISKVSLGEIMHTAAINPGNSGGALFSVNGKLIGINARKNTIIEEGSELVPIEGMGYAIPIWTAKKVISDIETNNQAIVRPTLGVTVQTVNVTLNEEDKNRLPNTIINDDEGAYNDLKQGVVITAVTIDGNAYKAKSDDDLAEGGLRVGDVIYKVNDTVITRNDDISYEIGITMPGDKMNIVVFRQLTDGWHAFNYEVVMNA